MAIPLSQTLQSLEYLFPSTFINTPSRERLFQLTQNVPFSICPHAFGFESRLAEPGGAADFAFCIDEKGRGFLSDSEKSCLQGPWWQTIRDLSRQWGDKRSILHDRIKNLWIEFDLIDAASTILPRLYTGIKGVDQVLLKETLFKILRTAGKTPLTQIRQGLILQCIENLGPRDHLFQVGLSPVSQVLRLCIKMQNLESVQGFLRRMGLNESIEEVRQVLSDYRAYVKSFCLHLDIGESIQPPIGVELHIADDPFDLKVQELWTPLLHHLVSRGLCLKEKAEALLKWPGCSYERGVPGMEPYLTYRFLYYLKVVFDKRTAVKGYFGFVNKQGSSLPIRPVTGLLQKGKSPTIEQAIERGINFLYKHQLGSGEFRTLVSPSPGLEYAQYDSSPFVTACVLYSTSFCHHPLVKIIQERDRVFLLSLADNNLLWKYWTPLSQKSIDPDMDDTSLISFVLEKLLDCPEVAQNKPLLLSNHDTNNLFSTWIRNPLDKNDVDTVVNSNVLLYLGESSGTAQAVKYIKDCIRMEWESGSYWYYTSDFALYYALSRAYHHGVKGFEEIKSLIIDKIKNGLTGEGAGYKILQRALALCTLLNFDYPEEKLIDHSVQHLLKTQDITGSWPGEPYYTGPEPLERYLWFGSEELTTSLCLETLRRYQKL